MWEPTWLTLLIGFVLVVRTATYTVNADGSEATPVTPTWTTSNTTARFDCDRRLFSTGEGVISSPGYPHNYPTNVDCNFLLELEADNTTVVELDMRVFRLESCDECSCDYFQLGDGRKVCGNETSSASFLANGQTVMGFHSGPDRTYGAERVFYISYKTMALKEMTCFSELHERQGYLATPGYLGRSSYPSTDEACSTTYRNPGGTAYLRLTIVDDHRPEGCEDSYISLNGVQDCSQKPAGYTWSTALTSHDLGIEVWMKENLRHFYRGTVMKYEIIYPIPGSTTWLPPTPSYWCDVDLDNTPTRIYTPGYPNLYPYGAECNYMINLGFTGSYVVELQLAKFDLSYCNDCTCSYLRLGDGRKLCQDLSGSSFAFVVNGKSTMAFHSGGAPAPGFDIGYDVSDLPEMECNNRISDEKGYRATPGYFSREGSVSCKMYVQTPPGYVRKLVLTFLGDNRPSGCSDSYLRVGDNMDCIQKDAGYTMEVYGIGNQDTVAIEFFLRSEIGRFYRGMAFGWKFEMDPTSTPSLPTDTTTADSSCRRYLNPIEGEIIKTRYERDRNCTWYIRPYHASVLTLDIKSFSIPDYRNCSLGYFRVGHGEKMCGSYSGSEDNATKSFFLGGNGTTEMQYVTIGLNYDDHFNMSYKVTRLEDLPCGKELVSPSGYFATQGYLNSTHSRVQSCRVLYKNYYRRRLAVRILVISMKDPETFERCATYFQSNGDTICSPFSPGYVWESSYTDEDLEFEAYSKYGAIFGYEILESDESHDQYSACDQTLSFYGGNFRSAGFPNHFFSGANCRYTLDLTHYGSNVIREASDAKYFVVELDMKTFELPDDSSSPENPYCRKTYLELGDGRRLCGSMRGSSTGSTFVAKNVTVMTFQADPLVSTRTGGFDIQYRVIPIPDVRSLYDGHLPGPYGYLTGPPGHDMYSKHYSVRYINYHREDLYVRVTILDLGWAASCSTGFIRINDDIVCGETQDKTIQTETTGDLEIEFYMKSQPAREYSVPLLRYAIQDPSAPTTARTPDWTDWTTPGWTDNWWTTRGWTGNGWTTRGWTDNGWTTRGWTDNWWTTRGWDDGWRTTRTWIDNWWTTRGWNDGWQTTRGWNNDWWTTRGWNNGWRTTDGWYENWKTTRSWISSWWSPEEKEAVVG